MSLDHCQIHQAKNLDEDKVVLKKSEGDPVDIDEIDENELVLAFRPNAFSKGARGEFELDANIDGNPINFTFTGHIKDCIELGPARTKYTIRLVQYPKSSLDQLLHYFELKQKKTTDLFDCMKGNS